MSPIKNLQNNINIFKSSFSDPYKNLTLGSYLGSFKNNGKTLLLSSSSPSVSIGNNQNYLTECDMKSMTADGIPLIRRDTGGGACYIDQGNRFYTFINNGSNIAKYKKDNTNIITNALISLGLNAKESGRNDILVNDTKVSGTAFKYSNGIFRQHGTIMLNVNKDNLSKYLTPKFKLKSHGIQSVKSRVSNLIDHDKNITSDILDNAIINSFNKSNNVSLMPIIITDEIISDKPLFDKILRGFQDENYIFNKNIGYDYEINHKFVSGIFEFRFVFRDDELKLSHVYSDCLDVEFVEIIRDAMMNYGVTTNGEIYALKIYDGIYVDDIEVIFETVKQKMQNL